MYPGIAVVSLWCVGGREGEKGEFIERERERGKEMRKMEASRKVTEKEYKRGRGGVEREKEREKEIL